MDTTTSSPDSYNHSECQYGCSDGYVFIDNFTVRECRCMSQRAAQSRLQYAMIPEEFDEAAFETYRTDSNVQVGMLQKITEYLKEFDSIRSKTSNSFGFIAKFGEQKLRDIKNSAQRSSLKAKHNNFGVGKTHLQMAAAKELIGRGYTVLCISDVAYMDEVSKSRVYNDNGEAVNKLIGAAVQAAVLIWDDIGKAKPSEFRHDMYYQVINERYKTRRPIIFSSNEDSETLSERIGDASASRLLGMARGRVYAVEGPDHRLTGGTKRG